MKEEKKDDEMKRPLELLPTTVDFQVQDDVLTVDGLSNKIKMETFLKQLKNGMRVSVTYELINDDKSYAQLAKVHACIREIAKESGHSPADIKDAIKDKAHLYAKPGELKSFGDCSKSELSLAIQAALEIADGLRMNLH